MKGATRWTKQHLWGPVLVLLVVAEACARESPNEGTESARVGPAGATVTLKGVTLEIPPGALAAAANISVTAVRDVPDGYDVDGLVYQFEPSGLRFEKPITVRLPTGKSGESMHWSLEGNESAYEPLATSLSANRGEAHPNHFSRGFMAPPNPLVAACYVTRRAKGPCTNGSCSCTQYTTIEQNVGFAFSGPPTDPMQSITTNGKGLLELFGKPGGTPFFKATTSANTDYVGAALPFAFGNFGSIHRASSNIDFSIHVIQNDLSIKGCERVPVLDIHCDIKTTIAMPVSPDAGPVVDSGVADSGLDGSLDGGTNAGSDAAPDAGSVGPASSKLSGGALHTCVVTAAGGVKCWGINGHGELGNNTIVDSSSPVDVFGLASGIDVVSAGQDTTCALTTGGGLKCWGTNFVPGQANPPVLKTPFDFAASGVAAIETGWDNACFITTTGAARCWGRNSLGSLGDDTTTDTGNPVEPIGLSSGVTSITTEDYATCAIQNGAAKCWGFNAIGIGVHASRPTDVVGSPVNLIKVVHTRASACALTSTGGVTCWGNPDFGMLGSGVTPDAAFHAPADVLGLTSGVRDISAGGTHVCAVLMNNSAVCWGRNDYGQLGDGTKVDALAPVPVSVVTDIESIVGGERHGCARKLDASIVCWGGNNHGQLGNGNKIDSLAAVNVLGFP